MTTLRLLRETITLTRVSVSTGTYGRIALFSRHIGSLHQYAHHTHIRDRNGAYVANVLETPEQIFSLLNGLEALSL